MSTAKERLQQDLEKVQAENQRSLYISGGLFAFIAFYLIWAGSQLNILLDPEGMAEAATGIAIESIPEVSATLTETIKDAAPSVAQQASEQVVDIIPMYREKVENEIKPIIDEVSGILAETSVHSVMASMEKVQNENTVKNIAVQKASENVIEQLDLVLKDALAQPGEDGTTPAESIEAALTELRSIDRELKKIKSGRGDSQERELLMTWLNIVSQQ